MSDPEQDVKITDVMVPIANEGAVLDVDPMGHDSLLAALPYKMYQLIAFFVQLCISLLQRSFAETLHFSLFWEIFSGDGAHSTR